MLLFGNINEWLLYVAYLKPSVAFFFFFYWWKSTAEGPLGKKCLM